MDTQLNIDPAQALEFIHLFQGNIVRKFAASRDKNTVSASGADSNLSPSDHGKHVRRIPQSAHRMNYQIRFINLVV